VLNWVGLLPAARRDLLANIHVETDFSVCLSKDTDKQVLRVGAYHMARRLVGFYGYLLRHCERLTLRAGTIKLQVKFEDGSTVWTSDPVSVVNKWLASQGVAAMVCSMSPRSVDGLHQAVA
jgi:hypothetical protein